MVTMQDALNTVRELTEILAFAARGALIRADAKAAFEAGNRFLIAAGHEPVDDYEEA